MDKYDALLVDVVNTGYKVFKREGPAEKIGNKFVFKSFVRAFIENIEFLKNKFLKEEGEIYLLFDNYTSREEIKKLFFPAKASDTRKKINPQYKEGRKKESVEFYNSLDLIKFYYMVGQPEYKTVQITKLEADDLVKPCISFLETKRMNKILMVTNDSDWCRYLIKDHISYLPSLVGEPETYYDFYEKRGYYPSEEKIILHKILEGDKADNIEAVFPEFSSKEILSYVRKYSCVEDFLYGESENLSFNKKLKEREKQLKISYQMIATIPISEAQFKYNCVSGRRSKIQKNVLDSILFPPENSNKFEFGKMKVPRVVPGED